MRVKLIMPRMVDQEFRLLPLNLAVLASLTPPEIEISVVDEAVEKTNFDEQVDLVAVSCTSTRIRNCGRIPQTRYKGCFGWGTSNSDA